MTVFPTKKTTHGDCTNTPVVLTEKGHCIGFIIIT